jgi:hypothetical protein
MNKIRKIRALLGIKGLLAIASLTSIAIALVVYTTAVTINPTSQFTLGTSADTWTVYVNEVNEVRYLPGADTQPGGTGGVPSAYAFRATGNGKACAVQIELTSAVDSTLFSNFEIRVLQWVPATNTWAAATLYDQATGGSSIGYINGLGTPPAIGYIQQPGASADTYYLVEATYSYDKLPTLTSMTVTFQYTPLPA